MNETKKRVKATVPGPPPHPYQGTDDPHVVVNTLTGMEELHPDVLEALRAHTMPVLRELCTMHPGNSKVH